MGGWGWFLNLPRSCQTNASQNIPLRTVHLPRYTFFHLTSPVPAIFLE
jgi:hypothetical protein